VRDVSKLVALETGQIDAGSEEFGVRDITRSIADRDSDFISRYWRGHRLNAYRL
jgi:hypothetical protein